MGRIEVSTPPSPMRRRLIAGFILLDGLCALAAPLIVPALLPHAPAEAVYVEISGTCVEEIRLDETAPAGRMVPMSFCTSA